MKQEKNRMITKALELSMVSNEPEYCDYDGMSALSCGIKRIFDAAVSLFGLIVTSPFFLLILQLHQRL